MKTAPVWLRILLLALPRGFRTEYGDEIRAHVAWMRARESAGAARVVAYVTFDVLRVGLGERLVLAGTMLASSTKLSRHSLAAGALLAFVGASVGYGAGIWLGFAFVPPALVIFAHGIVGRAIVTSPAHRLLVGLAALTATCAVALAVQLAFLGIGLDPLGIATTRAMVPVFITLVASASLFGLTGLWQRRLPRVPGAMAALGGLMLLTGPLDLGRVAELGFWLWVAGWVSLGVLPWVSVAVPPAPTVSVAAPPERRARPT